MACEIAPQGVTAARSDATIGPVSAVASVPLEHGAMAPGLKPGNLVDRVAIAAAFLKVMEEVGARPNTRTSDVTVIIPDGACRVLLLDFDSLPSKLSEALPLVRFRLKKLVPFDADSAMVTFQVMSHSKQLTRVLAVAIPRDVLAEYEDIAREAGFEAGAVLPSTLASLAGLDETSPTMTVNVGALSVTTAITRDGLLLLHRTVDLQIEPAGVPMNIAPELLEPSLPAEFAALPLVSLEDTQAEWAAQEALPEHGRNPYAPFDQEESAVQNIDGITSLPVPPVFADLEPSSHHHETDDSISSHAGEALPPSEFSLEVAQAVNVAAAYFEDTLAEMPSTILCGGTLSASSFQRMLEAQGVAEANGMRVRELVSSEAVSAEAVSSRIPRGWMAGVVGALRG